MKLDKQTTLQIFGSLMKNPLLLTEVENYNLTPSDFETTFEKYIFGAIYNLTINGVGKITVVDIDNYLSERPAIYETFKNNNGIEYLQDAEDLSDSDNFKYYYNKLKKYNLLKDLKMEGFDTNRVYPEDGLYDEDDTKKIETFENMTVQDICDIFKAKLATIESNYDCANVESDKANKNILKLLEELKACPEVGANCQGGILNTIVRGSRLGKFYLRSAASGVGKTRSMIGDACYIAYPVRYNPSRKVWEHTGNSERVLYVATEQKLEEIQTMILSYISGINEEKLLYGTYNEEEKEIFEKAIKIMDMFQDNLIIARIPDPNFSKIKTMFRKHCLNDDVQYVFYDYIFSSPSLLSEFRDLRVREDRPSVNVLLYSFSA